MNTIPVIGIYAALCREEGRAFSYPGHISYPREAVDARLIGDAAVWAAGNPRAWGEHYNLTNGEVFSWRNLWPGLAAFLRVRPGPARSEGRRGGKECVGTWKTRGWPGH